MTEKFLEWMFSKYFCIRFKINMFPIGSKDIAQFFVVGINYKKTDATIRGLFAINNDQYTSLLTSANAIGLRELFVLSTCNRTELYGFCSDASQLIQLLCAHTQGTREVFEELSYIKNGVEAIRHLFHVGAGLDSQILGDYEIIGQIKSAARISKKHASLGPFMERLVNAVLQTSKLIKNQTSLSGGTVSVSFAAVQFIRNTKKKISGKKILLVGVGKIGRSTCKNLVEYLHVKQITLINRTEDKALQLASELQVQHASMDDLDRHVSNSDIIIVATNSPEPVILASHLRNQGDKLVIDLSMPFNVDPSASALPNVTLVNIDELSKLKDETLQKREAEVPAVKEIIHEQMDAFMDWLQMRKHVPVLKAVKTKLQEIHADPFYLQRPLPFSSHSSNSNYNIQKVLNGMAVKMRTQNQVGCHYIEAINEFLTTG